MSYNIVKLNSNTGQAARTYAGLGIYPVRKVHANLTAMNNVVGVTYPDQQQGFYP